MAVRAGALFIEVPVRHFTDHGRAEDVRAVLEDPDLTTIARAFEVNP